MWRWTERSVGQPSLKQTFLWLHNSIITMMWVIKFALTMHHVKRSDFSLREETNLQSWGNYMYLSPSQWRMTAVNWNNPKIKVAVTRWLLWKWLMLARPSTKIFLFMGNSSTKMMFLFRPSSHLVFVHYSHSLHIWSTCRDSYIMFQFCSVILLFPGKKIMFEHIVGDYCLKFIHYKFKYNLKNQHLPYLWTGSSGKEYRNHKMIFFSIVE